jgi:hypothetical protein
MINDISVGDYVKGNLHDAQPFIGIVTAILPDYVTIRLSSGNFIYRKFDRVQKLSNEEAMLYKLEN